MTKKTKTLCVTVGTREVEMLLEIVETCGFVSISEAVRAMIRRCYEADVQKCK
jgi:Arc/MetJ-type ribon-helix-helix transcriptional regulator